MREAFITTQTKQTKSKTHIPIYPILTSQLPKWLSTQEKMLQQWVKNTQFIADPGTFCCIPNEKGEIQSVLLGLESADDFLSWGALSAKLGAGSYCIEGNDVFITEKQFYYAALGWGLGFYQFTRYKAPAVPRLAKLVLPKFCDQQALFDTLSSICLARDLINTPAEDMGPDALENAVKTVAKAHTAKITVIKGNELLKQNYPTIHAVGRASHREPRVIDLRWGKKKNAPKITLVGKGVCFDSGGLDLKPSSAMLLMKKDMGGSAMMLALANMIMASGLPVQLRLLIGAVDNAVSGNSYRPGDVITTRSRKTVEITNTDAEGRLVLCDLLTEACSESPDIIIDFATLTGAARVALGEDLPAFYAQPQSFADELMRASRSVHDPIWQLPLASTYREKLKSGIADMVNAADSPWGGSITAALFLQAFLSKNTTWAHFDTPAWNFKAKPGRPIGGEVFGIRAVMDYLENRFKK